MNYREIGLRIQIAREDAGLNQKDLADQLGLSQSTLSNYEKGKRKFYLAQLQSIADQLGKPLEYFLRPITTEVLLEENSPPSEKSEMDEMIEIMNILRELPATTRQGAFDYIRYLQARRNDQ